MKCVGYGIRKFGSGETGPVSTIGYLNQEIYRKIQVNIVTLRCSNNMHQAEYVPNFLFFNTY